MNNQIELIEVENEIRGCFIPNAFYFVLFVCCRELKMRQTTYNLPKCFGIPNLAIEEKKSGRKAARGETVIEDTVQNFIFTYGCPPGSGVLANTTFAKDTINLLLKNFDITTGEVPLPEIFSSIVSQDAIFETASSSLSRKLVIERKDNIFGQTFFFYIRDMTYDKNLEYQGVRNEF